MKPLPWLAGLLAFVLAGCAGYRLGPTNGAAAGSRTVRVQYFDNRTLEPRLSEAVALALRKRFQQDGTYRLVSAGDADVVVRGQFVRFERGPLTFQPRDVASSRDLELLLLTRVVVEDRREGRRVVDQDVIARHTIRVGVDQASAERQAVPHLADDLANRVVPLVVDGSW
jgi:hypothetical protein